MLKRNLYFHILALCSALATAQAPIVVDGWKMMDAAKVAADGSQVSLVGFQSRDWYQAVVPGTVLTTLVNNRVYPEPLYGENMRSIPESLNKTSYWYRSAITIPASYAGRHVWLHFAGVNYSAEVWVNGARSGEIRGAFIRGDFDITPLVKAGRPAQIAVLVHPEPHPGVPHEHTIALGIGKNGGETAIDGPTFLSTIGWDWLAAVRDRDTGIWLPVTLSDSGPVRIANPFVRSQLSPDNSAADLTASAEVSNDSQQTVVGDLVAVVEGQGEGREFRHQVSLPPASTRTITFTPAEEKALHVDHPSLWWPNGYGKQNLSHLKLRFEINGHVSDAQSVQFGIRRIEYSVPDSENLTLSVNGVKVMARGGNWGLDEAMKRIPRERLDAQFRMTAMANLNIIRNWVGQSTSPDFYDLADKYGILLWDEFFQPNPADGPSPSDLKTYLANVTDKVKRFRNHPSIAIWCARNEGYPPKELDETLHRMMTDLDPTRLYQSNSADGRGVSSHGPYYWRAPRYFYALNESFKTETGSVSIPTMESIQGMMPKKDWETINDDWAQHDLAAGAQRGNEYPFTLARRYGPIRNLADFARKGQMANYEAFRAMFESRNAEMFRTTTGVITWMSHPAQPSFVWQLYHYDLEPNSALFAVQKAAERIHIQLNESNAAIQVVNNGSESIVGWKAKVTTIASSGAMSGEKSYPVNVSGSTTAKVGQLEVDSRITPLYFVKADLFSPNGTLVSTNLYWRHVSDDDFTGLEHLPEAKLDVTATSEQHGMETVLRVTITNPTKSVALLTHLQLRKAKTLDRVLPVFYSDNYLSLVPGEQRKITISAATASLGGETPWIAVDGFNVDVTSREGTVKISPNTNALPSSWPATSIVPAGKN